MLVADLMTKTVHTCRIDESLERAAHLLWEHDCGCLPVVGEHGHLHGMITDRDICMAAYTTGRPLQDLQVREAMAIDVASLRPVDTLRDAEMLMRNHAVRRLPVLDGEGRVIGVLTCNDLTRWADDAAAVARNHHDAVHLVHTLAMVGRARAPAPRELPKPVALVSAATAPLPPPALNLAAMKEAIGVAVAARRS